MDENVRAAVRIALVVVGVMAAAALIGAFLAGKFW